MNIKRAGIYIAILLFGSALFVSTSYARSCDLRVSAFSAPRNDLATMQQSTGTVAGQLNDFTVSTRIGKKAVAATAGSNDGFVVFENLKAGSYQVTLRKSGYQGAIYTLRHSCEDDGEEWVSYLRLWPGNSKTTARHVARLPRGVESAPSIRTAPADVNANQNRRLRPADIESAQTPRALPMTILGGVLNGKAIELPKPTYPSAAKRINASCTVSVEVLVDLRGNVVSARAISGHPRLRSSAESAARQAKFSPTFISGEPVKISGVIEYNFVP